MARVVISVLVCLLYVDVLAQSRVVVVSSDLVWRTATDNRLVKRGDAVQLGEAIVSSAAGDLMLKCAESKTKVYACSQAPCRVNACKDDSPLKATDLGNSISTFLSSLLTREPNQVVVAAARSGGNPTDAVLLMDDKGVHLGAALSRVLEGRYCLQLGGVPDKPVIETVTVAWDRALEPEGVVPSTISPGLYTIRKGAPGAGDACALDTNGTTAWVLIAQGADYEKANAAWRDALRGELAELERSGAGLSTMTTVRRGTLSGLANEVGAR